MKNTIKHISSSFHNIILLALSISFLAACTERIDITTEEEFQKLAVEAYLTPNFQEIKLTETSGYFSQTPPAAIEEAIVTIEKGSDIYQLIESTEKPGYYYPEDTVPVILSESYKLTITLKEAINGQSYYESEATMPERINPVDSTRAVWRTDFETWVVELYTFEPAGPDFYMFNASINGLPVTDSLSRIGITDDRIVDGGYLYGVYILFLREEEVVFGDTLTIATSTISEDYYNYLVEAQTELNPKNPLFSGPPANVKSNISNGAIGYFAVFGSYFTHSIVDDSQ